jgi:hypothetical protein
MGEEQDDRFWLRRQGVEHPAPGGIQPIDMPRVKGILLLTGAMFFFSFIGVFARLTGKDPFSVSFYRAFLAISGTAQGASPFNQR